jgi:hypothetical protein
MGSLTSSSTTNLQTSDQCAKLMTGNQGYGINPTPMNLQRTSSLEPWYHSTSSSSKMDLECHEGSTLQFSSQQYWIGNSKDDDDDDDDFDGQRLSIRSTTASHLSPSLLIINKQHSGGQKDATNIRASLLKRPLNTASPSSVSKKKILFFL